MPPKGVSADEKRRRMLEIFHDTKDVFQLKDIERIASKSKGIVSQSVKDVLQSLVDDDLVVCVKIGASNYFYSFPSQTTAIRKRKKADLEMEIKALEAKEAELSTFMETSCVGREDSDERQAILASLIIEENKNQELKAEIAKFKDCDPEIIQAMEQALKTSRGAVERWTENINLLQSYCDKNFSISRADFSRQFGISDDFEDF